MKNNIILNSDSYKYSMHKSYPDGTEYVYSYIESRGGEWTDTIFFGLQAFIKQYLITPITQQDIDIADKIITAHGEPFNREGWQYILDTHKGKLPISIKAAAEGAIIPTKNVLATIVNTDPKCYWLTTFLETAILRAIWYPTTVATNSYEFKKIINQFLEKNGDPSGIEFKLQDFGARGVSSMESAGLAGMGHLINFQGTDTVSAVVYAMEYYNAPVSGFSIPASEHSISSSFGSDNERGYVLQMLDAFAKPGALVAMVADTFDVYAFCNMLGTDPEIKNRIETHAKTGGMVIVRPDSGSPSEVVLNCLRILDKHFGHTVNEKGYRVLNSVRIIQGDGIDHPTVRSILFVADLAGYSADNIAFGSGGKLLQSVNRDSLKFAMKASAVGIRERFVDADGLGGRYEVVWRDVFKDPITDPGKVSKKGRVTLWKCGDEYESSIDQPTRWVDNGFTWLPALEPVFANGELLRDMTFAQVRENARK